MEETKLGQYRLPQRRPVPMDFLVGVPLACLRALGYAHTRKKPNTEAKPVCRPCWTPTTNTAAAMGG